jgi:hypothetical protein
MPMVNGKKYPYTKEGKAAAEKDRNKKMHGGKVSSGISSMEKACVARAGKNNSVTY